MISHWDNVNVGSPLTMAALNHCRNQIRAAKIECSKIMIIPQVIIDSAGFHHAMLGLHADFKGRPYRRGKGRCLICGANVRGGLGYSKRVKYRRLQDLAKQIMAEYSGDKR